MPPIKLACLVSFTSEDPNHKAENLLRGEGKWLSNPNDNSDTISIEFQLEKALTINYIDIGNQNSAMVFIEVGMSSWPISRPYMPLLPTVVLMNPIESRCGANSTSVRMFKMSDFDSENSLKKWDRVRITLSQKFKKKTQFGLSFLKLYSDEFVNCPDKHVSLPVLPKKDILGQSSSPLSLKRKRCSIAEKENYSSVRKTPEFRKYELPISRGAQLVSARKTMPAEVDKSSLEKEVIQFLFSVKFTAVDLRTLKVSDIREQFEHNRGNQLNLVERRIFKSMSMDFATQRLRELESSVEVETHDLTLSSDEENHENAVPNLKNKLHFKTTPSDGSTASHCSENRFNFKLIDSPNDSTRKFCTGNEFNFKRNDTSTDSTRNQYPASTFTELDNDNRNDSSKSNQIMKIGSNEKDCTRSTNDSTKKSEKTIDEFHSGSSSSSSLHSQCVTEENIECPLCLRGFEASVIEQHASLCRSQTPLQSNFIDANTLSENEEKQCPVCDLSVSESHFITHVQQCADEKFC